MQSCGRWLGHLGSWRRGLAARVKGNLIPQLVVRDPADHVGDPVELSGFHSATCASLIQRNAQP